MEKKENEKKQKVRKETKVSRLKNFKEQSILKFIDNYSKNSNFNYDSKSKIKLTSSDYFSDTIHTMVKKVKNTREPIVIGQVSGFFETASLAGLITSENKSKPVVLFFDKNNNNIQNAIFNTLLMTACSSRKEYLTAIFGLNDLDIVKVFNSKAYEKIYSDALAELNSDENSASKITEEKIEKHIMSKFISKELLNKILTQNFSLAKLEDYVSNKKYNKEEHLKLLLNKVKKSLNKEMFSLFKNVANTICTYFSLQDNFQMHYEYLLKDIKRNDLHILDNEDIYQGYRKLITKKGTGNVKFLPNIDISQKEDLKQLYEVMKQENLYLKNIGRNKFSVDVAFVPHIRRLAYSYPWFKKISQYFIETTRDHKKKEDAGMLVLDRTSTLYNADREKMGAKFMDEEIKNTPSLLSMQPIEKLDGFDFMTIAGINIGSAYTSYPDVMRLIDFAKVNKVNTVLMQSLIFSEHKRFKTKERNVSDKKFPTLDSRLKEAKKIVDDLNNSGSRVIYALGDEDYNLREELFYTYFHKELKETNNFLIREDTDEKHDWIKEVIYNDLIPYMLRSGKDIITYYDDEGVKKTRIGEVCAYINAIKQGLPLGDLENLVDEEGLPLINEEYLKNNEMFKIVHETIVDFDKNNSKLSVDMVNATYSFDTQYANPDDFIKKRMKLYQTGAIEHPSNSQIMLDSRQGYMGASLIGGREAKLALTTPQLTADERFLNEKFLSGQKRVLSSPTYKRVNQKHTTLNFPGGWHISGDLDQTLRITPYWKRSKEVMDYVQRDGNPLPKVVELFITDIQTGSITERLETLLKFIDYAIYTYKPDIVSFLGDIIQGWNYQRFGLESRHTSAQSIGQQTVDILALLRPYFKAFFGVVPPDAFEIDANISSEESDLIFDYLIENDLIEKIRSEQGFVYAIKDDIDYTKIELPERLKPYEEHIKRRLNTITLVKQLKIVEGNHCKNSDWLHKGYKPLESLKAQLQELAKASGADVDIQYAEYIMNKSGDFVEGSYSFSVINGYNILSAHSFKPQVKGAGGSPCRSMASVIESIGPDYKDIHMVDQGHLHVLDLGVINGRLYSTIPGMAGQSGFEQERGYYSHPGGLLRIYQPGGLVTFDKISPAFIDNWEIQNPEIRKIGLRKHVMNELTQKAIVIASEMPEQIHAPLQRTLAPAPLTRKIGPKIS